MKRFFAIVLSLVLTVGVIWGLPVKAYAEEISSISFEDNTYNPTAGSRFNTYSGSISLDVFSVNEVGNVSIASGTIGNIVFSNFVNPSYDGTFQYGTDYYIEFILEIVNGVDTFSDSISLTENWHKDTTYTPPAGTTQIRIYKKLTVLPAPDPIIPPPDGNAEPVPPLKTINYIPKTLTSWEKIVTEFSVIGKDNLELEEESADSLLKVDIVGKEDKTVPSSVVNAMDKSSVYGLHVYIGDSDAVTFLNDLSYVDYTEKNFNHIDTITETGRTIDFTDKGLLNSKVLLHTVVAANTNATIYKVVDGKETVVGKVKSTENGRICFGINELATYIIKY